MEEAERLCDRIGIIDSGRLQAEGTRDELIRLTGGVGPIRLGGSGDLAAAAEELRRSPASSRSTPTAARRTLTVKRRARTACRRSSARRAAAGVTLADVEITQARPGVGLPAPHRQGPAGLRDPCASCSTLTASDLRQRIRDKSVIIFALVVPLALMIGLQPGLRRHRATSSSSRRPSRSARPRTTARRRRSSTSSGRSTAPTGSTSPSRGRRGRPVARPVEDGDAAIALIVPDGFGAARRRAGEPVTVEAVRGDEAGHRGRRSSLSVVDGDAGPVRGRRGRRRGRRSEGVAPAELGALIGQAAPGRAGVRR